MLEDVRRGQIHQRTAIGIEQRFAAELLERHRSFLDEQENAALAYVPGDVAAPTAGNLVVRDHVRQVEIVEQTVGDLAFEFRYAADLHVHRGVQLTNDGLPGAPLVPAERSTGVNRVHGSSLVPHVRK
jgi:hypothetical protein